MGDCAAAVPTAHDATTSDCSGCHTTSSWAAVGKPDHSLLGGTCTNCHNNPGAAGTDINLATHFPITSNNCDSCHTTASFVPASFDHGQANTATCFTCHTGNKPPAPGKSTGHMNTSTNCESCHSSFATWVGANFDHNETTATCVSCHDGNHSPAAGKSLTHFKTTTLCESCHVDTAWAPVVGKNFDHSQASGTCFQTQWGI